MGEEILKGFTAIQRQMGNPAEVEVMRQIKSMKLAGYDVKKDENGEWIIPASEIDRFMNGGKVPEAKPAKPEGAKEDPPGDGPFKIEMESRGKWTITDTRTGEVSGPFTKKEASALVNEMMADDANLAEETGEE